MAATATLTEGPDTVTVCGDLVFDTNRYRGLTVVYNIGRKEPFFVYWWSGSRRAQEGTYALHTLAIHEGLVPEVDTSFAASLWLGQDYDGVGVVGINSAESTLAPAESVFVAVMEPSFGRNYMLQQWREKLPPVPGSAQVAGLAVTLSWTNRHGNRPTDSSVVFRNGAVRRTLDYLADSLVDTVPGYGTYVYRLKHVAGPVINHSSVLVSPNSPSSDSLVAVVAPPPSLAVAISGPDYLMEPGTHRWTAQVAGGTSPYTYAWWYDAFGGGVDWQLVSTTTRYTRTVTYQDLGFTLLLGVTDAAQQTAADTLLVFTDWGYKR
jgi:hypothetical protein